jgi:hypothetical protein
MNVRHNGVGGCELGISIGLVVGIEVEQGGDYRDEAPLTVKLIN